MYVSFVYVVILVRVCSQHLLYSGTYLCISISDCTIVVHFIEYKYLSYYHDGPSNLSLLAGGRISIRPRDYGNLQSFSHPTSNLIMHNNYTSSDRSDHHLRSGHHSSKTEKSFKDASLTPRSDTGDKYGHNQRTNRKTPIPDYLVPRPGRAAHKMNNDPAWYDNPTYAEQLEEMEARRNDKRQAPIHEQDTHGAPSWLSHTLTSPDGTQSRSEISARGDIPPDIPVRDYIMPAPQVKSRDYNFRMSTKAVPNYVRASDHRYL